MGIISRYLLTASAAVMKIWDLHCHLPSRRLPGSTLLEDAEQAIHIADRVGIERLCVFFEYWPADYPAERIPGRNPRLRQSRRASDEDILGVFDRFGHRIFGFLFAFQQHDLDLALRNLERWVRDGPMVGLKLGSDSGVISKLEYDPLIRRAIELKAVIFQHTWFRTGDADDRRENDRLTESTPHDVVEVARRYPNYSFIAGHSGGDWEAGIRAASAVPNVLVGIGGAFPERGWVEMGVRELGADRVIYGSDIPGRSFGSQLGKVYGANITEDERALVFSGNLHRLMQPILKKKGIDVG